MQCDYIMLKQLCPLVETFGPKRIKAISVVASTRTKQNVSNDNADDAYTAVLNR